MALFNEPGPWYRLDPDFRRDVPKNTALYCCRCQRKVEKNYRVVEVDWDTHRVRNNPLGKDLIGNDCWAQVQKDPVNENKK